jgi:hypothetical protein
MPCEAHGAIRLQRGWYHRPMRDLQFDDVHLFARVAELGTLSAAARERDMPVSQISRTLARIEKSFGAAEWFSKPASPPGARA